MCAFEVCLRLDDDTQQTTTGSLRKSDFGQMWFIDVVVSIEGEELVIDPDTYRWYGQTGDTRTCKLQGEWRGRKSVR
jgi:hypothetical protein